MAGGRTHAAVAAAARKVGPGVVGRENLNSAIGPGLAPVGRPGGPDGAGHDHCPATGTQVAGVQERSGEIAQMKLRPARPAAGITACVALASITAPGASG